MPLSPGTINKTSTVGANGSFKYLAVRRRAWRGGADEGVNVAVNMLTTLVGSLSGCCLSALMGTFSMVPFAFGDCWKVLVPVRKSAEHNLKVSC